MYVISWSPSERAVCSKTEKRPTRSSSQPNLRSGSHTANILAWLHTGKPGERVRLAVYEEHRGLGTSMLALTQESGLSARAGGRNFGIA